VLQVRLFKYLDLNAEIGLLFSGLSCNYNGFIRFDLIQILPAASGCGYSGIFKIKFRDCGLIFSVNSLFKKEVIHGEESKA